VRRLLPGINISPPGYTSVKSWENIAKGAASFALNLQSWDEVVAGHYAIVGSPETVTELLSADVERMGVGNLLGLFQLGTLPAEDTKRNLELFAHEVMPKLRATFGTGIDAAPLAVEVHAGGEGGPAPLLYLHSAQGEGPGLALLEELADTRRVAVALFPGFGTSEGLDRIEDIEDAAFHVLDVTDRLGWTRCDVVSMSLGGWMAAEVAVRWPDRIRRLVLVNAVGLYVEGAPIAEIFGRPLGELADDLFADRDHPLAQLMRAVADTMEHDPAAVPFDLIRPVLQSQAATAKVGWNPYLHDPKLRGRLNRIASPTLVIHGLRDGIVPRAHAEAYVAGIPDAQLVDLDGAAHLAVLERPDEVAKLVLGHIGD
jgi:pimeloyl-ACP methyl ester carboxylesterase